MFEAADNLKFVLICWVRAPLILIDEGKILLDGRREVIVILNKIVHSFSLEIFHFIEDNVDSLFKVTFLLPFPAIELSIKLNHRVLILCIGPSHPILHQFQYAILDQHNCDIMLRNSIFSEWAKVSIDSLERCLNCVLALVVHADTDQHFYSLEVVSSLLSSL